MHRLAGNYIKKIIKIKETKISMELWNKGDRVVVDQRAENGSC